MKLTKSQLNDIIEQYVEIIVDGMDTKCLVAYVTTTMQDSLCKLGQEELEETIATQYDMNLFKELADNVINEDITNAYKSIPSRY
tara:strand:+ start:141 stop:395 length:255 start_codon:yes stop_codon:yes gene_type:complete